MSLVIAAIWTKLKAKVLGQGRLIVEYLMIVAVVILGTVSVNLYIQDKVADRKLEVLEGKLSDQNVKLFELVNASQEQTSTISQLMSLRTKDATAIEGLVTDFKSLADTSTKVDQRLKELEESNEAVRTYLQSDIPAPLMCLLNRTCEPKSSNKNSDNTGATK